MQPPIIKNISQHKEVEKYNVVALSTFLHNLTQIGAKALFLAGIDSTNRIQIVFVDGITIEQVRELTRQITRELDSLGGTAAPTGKVNLPIQ